MFYYLFVTLYVVACLVLMIVILLQQGKGGDIANAFGGGSSQAVFGARLSTEPGVDHVAIADQHEVVDLRGVTRRQRVQARPPQRVSLKSVQAA